MVYFTLFILCTSLLNYCYCFQVPSKLSSIGDNVIVLCVLAAAFGTISLIGACAICFRRKKTFEKLENEAGSPENIKKNEFPIFRALSTEINESSAIVPCERNNLSRDNLLNSSDNLDENESDCLRRNECTDSSGVILLEKTPTSSQREKSQQLSRDTILFETEKKYQSPSSKTPLLYAKNVQSYQEQQPINEQIQQKSVAAVLLSPVNDTLNDLYEIGKQNADNFNLTKEVIDEAPLVHRTASTNESKSYLISSSNPFFSSTTEDDTVKEVNRDDTSEIESSINDNSEKYQILEEETDCEEAKVNDSIGEEEEELPVRLERQNSKSSTCSTGDKSIEEALRALDIAIGFEEDDDELEIIVVGSEAKVNLEEIKEEATFLVDSIVNDCEEILKQKESVDQDGILYERNMELCSFEDFSTLRHQYISTPNTIKTTTKVIQMTDNSDIAKALFPNGVDLSTNETFPVLQEGNNQTFDVSNIDNKAYDTEPSNIPTIKIEKERDEMSSEDLSTVTPVNTPIELSYSNETWHKTMSCEKPEELPNTNSVSNEERKNFTFVSNENNSEEIKFNHDGWYLHSQNKSDTFDIIGEDDNEEGNMEDMSSTFDQLRRQLTEMLPHAQGMSAHNDFLDDDDLNKDSNSPSDNYGITYGELDEASNAGSFDLIGCILNPEPVAELNINYNNNYKRPLSPILEESECDETCRTFVMNNETRLLDSTSTGIMESASGDAVMGQMPKTLMASNDTLFNFEDTLSDTTDLMSPRIHTAGSSSSSTLSRQESQDRISNERTPTNEELPKMTTNDTKKCQDAINILKNNIIQHPLNLELNVNASQNPTKYELAKITLQEDGSWPLDLPEAQNIINDLSSPEQNRTADSLSFEQDITYTIDDQKTCVSLILKNDEERISEISEPFFASESLDMMLGDDDDDDDKANSLIIDDAVSLDIDDNFNFELNDENGNQHVIETVEEDMFLEKNKEESFENDSMNAHQGKTSNFEVDSLEPNSEKILIDEMQADSIAASQISKSVYSNDSINDYNNSVQNITNIAVNEIKEQDSSEDNESNERKKSTQDIRQVSCNQSVMRTSFSKEWSDDDSSHSSIEFMYVKGGDENVFSKTRNEEGVINSESKQESENENQSGHQNDDNVTKTEYQEWNIETMPHRKSPTLEDVGESEDDESGEEESEFIPSSWDQSLQPMKSSLKSPEKEKEASLDQEQDQMHLKAKRRVVFKIQRYHSVYEYPSEVVQLSPAYSEPQLWSNYLDDGCGSIDYFTYSNQLHDISNTIDGGFNISSTSRPFHGNNMQLHNTWPNENDHDFSWSQFQDTSNENNETGKLNEIPLKIEWPIRKSICFDEDDSGLCETSESPSIAELNYSKGSLRLPIELISSSCSEVSDFMSTDTKELEAVAIDIDNDECLKPKIFTGHDNELMPTPSGSMDSLSSNSHSASSNSSSPPSFTTFGKDKISKETDLIGKKSIIFIDDDRVTQLENVNQKRSKSMEAIESIKAIVGSSDDDSGFENVKCEAK